MIVSDMSGEHEATSLEEFEKILTKRFGEEQANEFWMCHDPKGYPTLAIVIKGDLACVHYLPAEGDRMFQSIGNLGKLKPGGITTFATLGEPIDVANGAILHLADALPAAREFLYSDELPKSIEWIRL